MITTGETQMADTFLIAYENSERGLAYYAEHGFPWWARDRETHATRYFNRDEAERKAQQLRDQRARAGRILVVAA
jgi:hypothetical protein